MVPVAASPGTTPTRSRRRQEAHVDERCSNCHVELEPGSWAQLLFDGTWLCEKCMTMPPTVSVVAADDRDNGPRS